MNTRAQVAQYAPGNHTKYSKTAAVAVLAAVALTTQAALTGEAAGAAPARFGAAAAGCTTPGLVSAIAARSDTGGTVTLASGCTYTLTAKDNNSDGGTGLPVINGAVTVVGNGATIVRAVGAGAFRLFEVAAGGSLSISNVTLRNGKARIATPPAKGFGGGAINSHGSLTVHNVTFDGNTAPSHTGTSGGAIDSAGPLAVSGSTFTGNVAQEGGAIFAQADTTITSTTFDGNTATDYGGGAIVSATGTTTITGSAFLNNVATDNGTYTLGGGAIDNDDVVVVSDSTFVNNSGGSNGGGAIQNFNTATITSSTMSGNTSAVSGNDIHTYQSAAQAPVTTDVSRTILASGDTACGGNAPVTDSGYNIDVDNSCGFMSDNHSLSNTDPALGALASAGNATPTMGLQPGSPAIDAIPAAATGCGGSTDQVGTARPQGTGCDIGAFEVEATHTTEHLGVASGKITIRGTVTDTSGRPQSGLQVVLQSRPYGSPSFTDITTVPTSSSGTYTFTQAAPTTLTHYRAITQADDRHATSVSRSARMKAPTSLALSVQVAGKDHFVATLTYTGTGGPIATQSLVVLRRWATSTKLVRQFTVTTGSDGRASFTVAPGRRAYYQVRFLATRTAKPSSSKQVYVPF